MGNNTVGGLLSGNYNTVIGNDAMHSTNTGGNDGNTMIGSGAAYYTSTTYFSTLVGYNAASNLTGTSQRNTWVGTFAGPSSSVSNTIAFSDGSFPSSPQMDWNYTTANVWTFAFKIAVPGAANPVLTTTAAITTGAGASAGTLTNAPAAGNPTKWIPISDAGTTRYIPAW
jgi:hypothetical protein